MSFDALAWAAKQNPGTSGTKLVLLGLAECANRQHGLSFPSLAELVEFTALDRKSVIANLDRLEAGGFITDTGRKVGRTGQIKVYKLNLQTVPESEQNRKRNSSENPANGPKNGTRNLSEPGIEGSIEPSRARAGKHLLPKDWKVPAVADLPPRARALAEEWTQEEYATHAEAFVSFWRGSGRMMKEWDSTWANRIVDIHSKVMRDRKFGHGPAADTPAKHFDQAEYDARLARIGRQDSTGPPRPIGNIVKRMNIGG